MIGEEVLLECKANKKVIDCEVARARVENVENQ